MFFLRKIKTERMWARQMKVEHASSLINGMQLIYINFKYCAILAESDLCNL